MVTDYSLSGKNVHSLIAFLFLSFCVMYHCFSLFCHRSHVFNILFPDGYTTDDVIYLWKYGNDKSVEVHDGVRMSQFDLKTVSTNNHTEKNTFGKS